MPANKREYNGTYSGEHLSHVAFPIGGIGAGMVCLEGTGAVTHISVRNSANIFHEPMLFAAISFKGSKSLARVLEGPIPTWKAYGYPGAANGMAGKTWGLPRFANAEFLARFPFGTVTLSDPKLPVSASITGWSPFIPGDSFSASMPVGALEYEFVNTSASAVEAVFSLNTHNFMAVGREGSRVQACKGGFVLHQDANEEKPWDLGDFSFFTDDPDAKVNCHWFRGGGFDPLTICWKNVSEAVCIQADPPADGGASPGASITVPVNLAAGQRKTVKICFTWYVPNTDIQYGWDPKPEEGCEEGCCCEKPKEPKPTYKPWYSTQFTDIEKVSDWWISNYQSLREQSQKFSDCFFDTTLPAEVVEAVAANLSIIKSPTMMRQQNGRLWCWEGCHDSSGCCSGSCTHVWNYAQAVPHLFPDLERTFRDTEFNESQSDEGHQQFRSFLPTRPSTHDFHAAADGQLGGIMKAYREWRISADNDWLRNTWPRIKQSLVFCINTWDPDHVGAIIEPHHNTYDIEFWGPDGMHATFYLGALKAAIEMGHYVGDDVSLFEKLFDAALKFIDDNLFDGEYYIQNVQWEGLRAAPPSGEHGYSAEALELLKKQGPKYQYGIGCLTDGVLGAWMAAVCGVPDFMNPERLRSHLKAIHKYNFKSSLAEHHNPQRPTFALGFDGGTLLCSWPKGGQLDLPFIYSNEVWTGIEYQAASHMMMLGLVEEGLEIVRAARDRYDGRLRDPFDEYECGHYYARAMSSYALIQGMTGIRYDAVDRILYVSPSIKGDFRSFISTATGYGTTGVKDGKPFIDVKHGEICIERVEYIPAE